MAWWRRSRQSIRSNEGGGGSPGGSRYVFSEATRSSTPSSEKFCLHPLPFIGDIYRLILLFHSSKFKHSKYPPNPVATSHDNWIGPASKVPLASTFLSFSPISCGKKLLARPNPVARHPASFFVKDPFLRYEKKKRKGKERGEEEEESQHFSL